MGYVLLLVLLTICSVRFIVFLIFLVVAIWTSKFSEISTEGRFTKFRKVIIIYDLGVGCPSEPLKLNQPLLLGHNFVTEEIDFVYSQAVLLITHAYGSDLPKQCFNWAHSFQHFVVHSGRI